MNPSIHSTIVDWNGADAPEEPRSSPAGKYVIQGVPHDVARERLLERARR